MLSSGESVRKLFYSMPKTTSLIVMPAQYVQSATFAQEWEFGHNFYVGIPGGSADVCQNQYVLCIKAQQRIYTPRQLVVLALLAKHTRVRELEVAARIREASEAEAARSRRFRLFLTRSLHKRRRSFFSNPSWTSQTQVHPDPDEDSAKRRRSFFSNPSWTSQTQVHPDPDEDSASQATATDAWEGAALDAGTLAAHARATNTDGKSIPLPALHGDAALVGKAGAQTRSDVPQSSAASDLGQGTSSEHSSRQGDPMCESLTQSPGPLSMRLTDSNAVTATKCQHAEPVGSQTSKCSSEFIVVNNQLYAMATTQRVDKHRHYSGNSMAVLDEVETGIASGPVSEAFDDCMDASQDDQAAMMMSQEHETAQFLADNVRSTRKQGLPTSQQSPNKAPVNFGIGWTKDLRKHLPFGLLRLSGHLQSQGTLSHPTTASRRSSSNGTISPASVSYALNATESLPQQLMALALSHSATISASKPILCHEVPIQVEPASTSITNLGRQDRVYGEATNDILSTARSDFSSSARSDFSGNLQALLHLTGGASQRVLHKTQHAFLTEFNQVPFSYFCVPSSIVLPGLIQKPGANNPAECSR